MATFYDRFVECAERWPQNAALEIQREDQVESYTYAETRRMAESVGRWLEARQLEPGSRCAILANNHPRWVAVYLGVIAAGHTAVPLDTALHADQVRKLLKDSGAVLLFCDEKHWAVGEDAAGTAVEMIRIHAGETPAPTQPETGHAGEGARTTQPETSHAGETPAPTQPETGHAGEGARTTQPETSHAGEGARTTPANLDEIFAAGAEGFRPVDSPLDAVASLLYTSGTTADPKGVMLTHANMLGEVEAVFDWAHLGPEDAVLGILPMFHVLAQMANLLLPLTAGARAVYLETLNTTELLRALRERKITAFAVVPQFFYLIHEKIFKEAAKKGAALEKVLRALMKLNRGLRKLGINAGRVFFGKVHETFGDRMRLLVTGGSRFDPTVGQDFYALGIDILQAYGLTETTAAAFITSPGDNVIGSVGKALKGIEGKIVNPQPSEDGGQPVGEIALRGTTIMKGYWNRADATAAVLIDGWLHTGDLGYFDAHGNLFITGRQKEVIVLSNGKNVYPEEIESHYLKSPYIKELCVMGIEGRPGDPLSDRLHAVVVPNFDALRQQKIVNTKEVIRFDMEGLSAQLPTTKRIASYEIWQEDLPRTTTRKIKRFEVQKRVLANQGKGTASDADVPAEKPLTAEESAWLEQPEVQRGLKVIREAAKEPPDVMRPGLNLELDLGLDSMQRVELLVALEEELGGDVEESRSAEIYTVRELLDAVLESAASGKGGARPQFAGWNVVLREEVADPEVQALVKPRPVGEAVWFAVSRLAQIAARDLFALRVSGLENLPKAGPYILCSNHQSFIDPVVLASVLPWEVLRRTFAVGTSDIFGSGFMRGLARELRVVVLDPDANLIPAMRAGAFGLRNGKVLILYPEGERSIDGTPRIFKKGAAILSIHMQAPIVPIAIEGFYEAWPRGKKFFQKRTQLKMRIGKPIVPPAESAASEETYTRLMAEVKEKVVEMWEGLRGA
ncbi:MAG: AMP-binding protein [Acidobacteria bacterium]|nr:AMP-binding protein [Acidobacteriota bacterium]